MPEQSNNGAAQFRADLPNGTEQESVRTTIVGGRPPGSGQPIGQIPRGIEILLKKAAVDEAFRDMLLHDPKQAVASIELELEPIEQAMLQAFPKEQLAVIINRTEVPWEQRRAFLGTAAATMLAILTGTQTASAQMRRRPDVTDGIRPDIPQRIPEPHPRNIPEEVKKLVAETTKVPIEKVQPVTQINLNDRELEAFRRVIYRDFDVLMPIRTLKTLNTLKLLTDFIVESRDGLPVTSLRQSQVAIREEERVAWERRMGVFSVGIRPDVPMPVLFRNIPKSVSELVAAVVKMPLADVNAATPINLNDSELETMRREIYHKLDLRVPSRMLKTLTTLELLTNYVEESLDEYMSMRNEFGTKSVFE